MADDSIKNLSQETVEEDELPGIVTDIKEFQVLMQDQAQDFMDVLLERTFLKLIKDETSLLTENEKEQLGLHKQSFLEKFRDKIGKSVEDIISDESIQFLLEDIMDASSTVTEQPDYLEEVLPIRTDFLKKLKQFKEDMSNETLCKEREVQYQLLIHEVKATKTTKNLLIKKLRRVNQELVDHISSMSKLTREGNDE